MRLAGTGGVLQASSDAEVQREGSAGVGGRDLEDIAYATLLARADTRGHKFKVLSLNALLASPKVQILTPRAAAQEGGEEREQWWEGGWEQRVWH